MKENMKLVFYSLACLCAVTICSASIHSYVVNATNTLIPNIEVPEITTDNVDEVINEIQENEINNLEYDEDMSSVLEADVYNDSEDNRYIFDEKKGLTGYSIDYESINVQENENLSINNANKMAMQYLSSLISNSAEYIQQLADFNEETFVYTYCFNKFKSGIKTTDMVVISFDSEQLISYSIPNYGVFDNIELSESEIDVLCESAKADLVSVYGDTVKINDCILNQEDGQIVLDLYITYEEDCENIEDIYTIVIN